MILEMLTRSKGGDASKPIIKKRSALGIHPVLLNTCECPESIDCRNAKETHDSDPLIRDADSCLEKSSGVSFTHNVEIKVVVSA